MADCDVCVHERSISQAERLARIEEQVTAVRHDIAEMVCTQIKDHGKRLAALERRAVWAAGWIAGAGFVGGLVGAGIMVSIKIFLGG